MWSQTEQFNSPDLFNLCVNGLFEELSSSHVGCHIGGRGEFDQTFKKLIFICKEYAKFGLQYSTVFMVLEHTNGPDFVADVCLNGSKLVRIDKFRYLGI